MIIKYLILRDYYSIFRIKIILKRSDKYAALSNLSIYYTWKNIKSHIKLIHLKYQRLHGIKNLNYLMGYILYQIFNITLNISLKHGEKTDNPSIRIYVNKVENAITFKINTGHYLDLLMPESTKLLKSTKSKITKDKNGENVPHLEITEVVLVYSNIVTMVINKIL